MNSILVILVWLSTIIRHFVAQADTNDATTGRGPLSWRGRQHDAATPAAAHPQARHPQVNEGLRYADLLRLR